MYLLRRFMQTGLLAFFFYKYISCKFEHLLKYYSYFSLEIWLLDTST